MLTTNHGRPVAKTTLIEELVGVRVELRPSVTHDHRQVSRMGVSQSGKTLALGLDGCESLHKFCMLTQIFVAVYSSSYPNAQRRPIIVTYK
ncbi:MAG: hypothetical protein ACK5Y7_03200, partial [Betaproteobacteria bacterium]